MKTVDDVLGEKDMFVPIDLSGVVSIRTMYREESLFSVITGDKERAKKAKKGIKMCNARIEQAIRKVGRRVLQKEVR